MSSEANQPQQRKDVEFTTILLLLFFLFGCVLLLCMVPFYVVSESGQQRKMIDSRLEAIEKKLDAMIEGKK